MAQPIFFGLPEGQGCSPEELLAGMFDRVGKTVTEANLRFNLATNYKQQDALYGVSGALPSLPLSPVSAGNGAVPSWVQDWL
jgi:hypothetical protein